MEMTKNKRKPKSPRLVDERFFAYAEVLVRALDRTVPLGSTEDVVLVSEVAKSSGLPHQAIGVFMKDPRAKKYLKKHLRATLLLYEVGSNTKRQFIISRGARLKVPNGHANGADVSNGDTSNVPVTNGNVLNAWHTIGISATAKDGKVIVLLDTKSSRKRETKFSFSMGLNDGDDFKDVRIPDLRDIIRSLFTD